MTRLRCLLATALLGILSVAPVHAQWRTIPLEESRAVGHQPRPSAMVDQLVEKVVAEVIEEVADGKVAREELWVTVIDARDPWDPRIGSWQGDASVYPASVVKMCYMVEVYDQAATGQIEWTEEIREDLRIMMSRSSNFATSRMVDLVSNTGFGPTLEGEARESFEHKRHATHRKMIALGLPSLYALNKTYATGLPLYGREMDILGQRAGDNYERSNKMSTDDTARLLYMLHRRALVSPGASEEMLGHMLRGGDRPGTYGTQWIPEGATAYSKDGGTNLARHDAALFEFEEGGAIIVVAFSFVRTTDGEYPPVVGAATRRLIEGLLETAPSLDNATADPDQSRPAPSPN